MENTRNSDLVDQ